MFDIGWGKIVIIAVIALIVIGPKELPAVLRTVGQWMGKIRRMAAEFQGQFQEAMREAEMADLKKHVDTIAEATRDIGGFDPLASARKDIESVLEEKPPAASDAPPPLAAAEPANAPEAVPIEPPVPVEPSAALPQADAEAAGPAGTDTAAPAPTPAADAGGRAA